MASKNPILGIIKGIVEPSDPYIDTFGAKGFERFQKLSAEAAIEVMQDKRVIAKYIKNTKEKNSLESLSVKVLTSLYIHYKPLESRPKILTNWMHERLQLICKGVEPNTVFSAKGKRGIKNTRPQHNGLMCVCYVELKMREGMSKTQAIRACCEQYTIGERAVHTFLNLVDLSKIKSEKTLRFYSENDISHLY